MTLRNTKLAVVQDGTLERLASVTGTAASAYAQASAGAAVNVVAALRVAESIEELRALMDQPEIKQRIVALQDTPIGFRTDRDPSSKNRKTNQPNAPYDWPVVRDAALEASLRGLQWVGNQFNVIASRFYATKEGFEYLIRHKAGLTEWKPVVGVPKNASGGALVECSATWKLNGSPCSLSVVVPVKTDEWAGADQIIGKATRKFYKRCYELMTGVSVPEGDAVDIEAVAVPTPAPVKTSEPRSVRGGLRKVQAIRSLLAGRGLAEEALLRMMVDTGQIEDSLRTLEDVDTISPEIIEHVFDHFGTLADALAQEVAVNARQLARRLDGRTVSREITQRETEEAKRHGLVVVFGAADDLSSFCGAIEGEADCYDGGTVVFTPTGLFFADEREMAVLRKHGFDKKALEDTRTFDAVWSDDPEGPSWTYKVPFPHAVFDVLDDDTEDRVFAGGFVFSVADAFLKEVA